MKTIKPPARRQGEGGRLSGKRCPETRTPIIDRCPTPISRCATMSGAHRRHSTPRLTAAESPRPPSACERPGRPIFWSMPASTSTVMSPHAVTIHGGSIHSFRRFAGLWILWFTSNVMFELPDEEIFVSDDSFHHIPD